MDSCAHGVGSALWMLLNSKCYSLIFSILSPTSSIMDGSFLCPFKPLKCNLHSTNTPFLLSTWWHVFIPAFCSLQRVRKATERRHTSKIIDLYRHTYSRQASIAFLIQTLKHVLICHLCLIFFIFPLFLSLTSRRKISYCNLKRLLDNLAN